MPLFVCIANSHAACLDRRRKLQCIKSTHDFPRDDRHSCLVLSTFMWYIYYIYFYISFGFDDSVMHDMPEENLYIDIEIIYVQRLTAVRLYLISATDDCLRCVHGS